MKNIVKDMLEGELGRTLTNDEEEIIDEHTEIVTELYKLNKRRKELLQKIIEMTP
jgi:hypothetical protein